MGFKDFNIEKVSGRPLEFIWILDTSGSMSGKRIQALNTAIRSVIPEMQSLAAEQPQAEIMMRVLTFDNTAKWHIRERVRVEDFKWDDVSANGMTFIDKAFDEIAKVLDASVMPARGLPPVLVLMSDGEPSTDYKASLNKLLSLPWGKKAVKIAIAISDDASLGVLQDFIDDPERQPLPAKNAAQLCAQIKYASTEVLSVASTGRSKLTQAKPGGASTASNNAPSPAGVVDLPPPPDISNLDKNDVF